ncbi:MAG TPA: ricin-type beta-trefoil lectin domain protein [Trebonia sp.]|nr:ricin-type beta-trefoil lectin domain protein [Trebonia sp.]
MATAGVLTASTLIAAGPASAAPHSAGVPPRMRPAATALPPGTRQACPPPSRPLMEQCQLLIGTARPGTRLGMRRAGARGLIAAPLTAADLREAYGLTAVARTAGVGQTVAVVDAYGDAHVSSDLARYRKLAGLGQCAGGDCLTVLNQYGRSQPLPVADDVGWSDETALDVEMVAAICPNCRIVVLEASSSSLASLGTAENSAARLARFVSNSWSGSDFPGESRYDTRYFDHPGVATTVASGDFRYAAGYPASSQLVTSVGGTYLYPDDGGSGGAAHGWSEVAWSGQSSGAGTGTQSGCSAGEPKPAWQSDPGCANRTENDVAAVADAQNGVDFYSSGIDCGGSCQAFGTSVATPIIAAVYALAGTPRAGTFPAEYPYLHPSGLHRVTAGADGSCEASRRYLCDDAYSLGNGYNGPDGLGTPSGTAAFTAPAGRMVSVINPGTYDLSAGLTYHLPAIRAYDSAAGSRLTFSATGLPGGMSISPSSGVISGRPAVSVATVRVTARDQAGARATVTFGIVAVRSLLASYHPGRGEVRLGLPGMCLDDRGNQAAKGNPVQVWHCLDDLAQRWSFQPSGAPGGTGELRIDGRCLDIEGPAGSALTLWPCTGHGQQQWLITGETGELYNPAARMCLSDPGGTRDGSPVDLGACHEARHEAWTLPASPIVSGLAGQCAAALDGHRIGIRPCDASAGQRFTLGLDHTIRIAGQCLDVTGGSANDGTPVQLSNCDGDASQTFRVTAYGLLHNPGSGKCLADPGDSTASGTQLTIEDCYGRPGEVWAVS